MTYNVFGGTLNLAQLQLRCRPENTGRQRRFTVKIKQIKRSDMVTSDRFICFIFLFCSHYYRSQAIRRAKQGRWIFQPSHLTWHALV